MIPLTKHLGVEVFYDDNTDDLSFEINGKEYHEKSLSAAKLKIAHPPKDRTKAQKFTPVECYLVKNWQGTELVRATITSIADGRAISFSDNDADYNVWVKLPDGKREKVNGAEVLPITPHNTELLNKITDLTLAIKKARSKQEEYGKLYKPFTPVELGQ